MTRAKQPAIVAAPQEASSESSAAPTILAEVLVAQVMPVETDIDIDLMDSPIKDTFVAAPVAEYQEDLIDYDDDELVPTAHDSGDDTLIGLDNVDIKLEEETTEAKVNSMAEEQEDDPKAMQDAAAQHFEQAKYMMSMGPQTLLGSSPEMVSILQLNNVGDIVTANACVNGVTYEITWKVAAIHGDRPQPAVKQPVASIAVNPPQRKTSLRDAPPLSVSTPSVSHSAVKCKFGSKCNKGASCTFDHTIKVKLCTWVNTAQGCTKGKTCEFSHENEGAKCTRSTSRASCANGKGCAFKHGDDVGVAPSKVKAITPPVEQIKAAPSPRAPTGPKGASAPPNNAPTGPKSNALQPAKIAGQKRSRAQDDDGGNAAQKRANNGTGNFNNSGNNNCGVKQQRGRGRGNTRARGRGRGGAAAGGELRIKGAAGGAQ